jgi:hypothetical protein
MNTCKVVLIRGKNKGKECGRKTTTEFCRAHQKSNIEEQGCEFILTRGARKGEKCNKKIKNGNFCYSHSPEVEYVQCSIVIERGTRKGKICGRRCKSPDTICSTHKIIKKNKSESVVEPVESVKLTKKTTSKNRKPVEPIVATVVEPDVDTVVEPVVATVVKPDVDTVVEPVVATVVEQDVDTVVEPVVATVVPDVDTVVEPVVEPNVEPEVATIICEYVFTRGAKKGQQCLKRNCVIHKPKKKTLPISNDLKDQQVVMMDYTTNREPDDKSSVIIFQQAGEIELDLNFECKLNSDIKKKTKINDKTSVCYEKGRFKLSNRTGKYLLNDILQAFYYIYNTCSEAKHTVKITEITLHSNQRLTDNARYCPLN